MQSKILTSVICASAFVVGAEAQTTVIQDAFERSTHGTANGALTFTPGPQHRGFCLEGTTFQPTARYAFNSWNTGEGTLECWLFPTAWVDDYLTFQWFDSWTDLGYGYGGDLGIRPAGTGPGRDGHLYFGSSPNFLESAGPMQLYQWSYVALAWSAAGTSMYIDGVEVSHNPANCGPSLQSGTNYLFVGGPLMSHPSNIHVPFWIDDLRLSNMPLYRTTT